MLKIYDDHTQGSPVECGDPATALYGAEMFGRNIKAIICCAFAVSNIDLANADDQRVFVQENISSANITPLGNGYSVIVRMLATDIEEIFQKTLKDRVGVDLLKKGAVEREIGEMLQKRLSMRSEDGSECNKSVIRSGEDPNNDEMVVVSINFDCKGRNIIYSASELLRAHSPRSWQIVTIESGGLVHRIMINSESQPIKLEGK